MAKKFAILFGVVFILVGLLGFVANPLVGAGGLFETDLMHDLVHIVVGAILLLVAFFASGGSALWLKILGIVYLLLAILGFATVPDGGPLLGFVQTNAADHWLHVVLGLILAVVGFTGNGRSRTASSVGAPPNTPAM